MKKLFSLLVALLCVNYMFSVEVLSTNFTQGQGEWTIDNVTMEGVTYVWKQDNQYGMKASAYYQSTNNVSESWLISPAFDLSDADTVSLYIEHALNYGSALNLAVKAKADSDADWTDLNVVWPQGNSWAFITSTSDISSAFAHKTGVQIAFVYVSDASSAPTWEIKNVVVSGKSRASSMSDPIEMESCSAAAAAALSVSGNNVPYYDGAIFTVVGFVTTVPTEYSAETNNMIFWMADDMRDGQVLEAFRVVPESADKLPQVGDVVRVTGKLTKYNNIPEFAAGCTCTIIKKSSQAGNLGEKTIAEFLELKNAKDTCILTGIVKNMVMDAEDSSLPNKYGNFDLVELGNDEVSVYIYGLLTADGQAQQFQTMGIEEGDTLKLKATYTKYNGKVEVRNAVFVEVKKAQSGEDEEDTNHPNDEDADFDVNFPSYTIDATHLQDGYVYVNAKDEDGNYVVLDITLPEGATGLVAGTYAVDDSYEYPYQTVAAGIYYEDIIYPSYAAVLNDDKIEKIWWIVSGQVVIDEDLNITVDAVNSLGKEVVAVLTAPVTPDEITITAEGTFQNKLALYGWWQFYAEDNNYWASVSNNQDMPLTQPFGTYTVEELDSRYSYVWNKNTSEYIHFVEGEVVIAVRNSGTKHIYTADGEFEGDDGKTYILHFTQEVEAELCYYLVGNFNNWEPNEAYKLIANPNAEGEYKISTTLAVADELKVVGVQGAVQTWYPGGVNNNYIVDAAHAGEMMLYFRPEGNSAWVSFHEGGFFYIDAKPEPRLIDVTINSELILNNQIETYGWWEIYGSNAKYHVELVCSSGHTQIAGTYPFSELNTDYLFVTILETDTRINFVGGTLTVSEDDATGAIIINGLMSGADDNIYSLHLTYMDPTAQQTVELEIAGNMTDYVENLGGYSNWGTADDGTYVQLLLLTDDPVGTFTAADLYRNYSFVEIGDKFIDIYEAEITVVLNNDGTYVTTANLLCYNNTLYKVTIIASAEATGLDALTSKRTMKYIHNGMLIIEKNGHSYNVFGQKLD